MADEQMPVLEVKHLSVDYVSASGTVHAVDDVSFRLRRGEILGLAGESGSGKSTLVYAIARLLRPPAVTTGGEVWYYPDPKKARANIEEDLAPVDVLDLTDAELRAFRWRRLSIVLQSAMNALNPVMTIGAQIMDVLRAHQPGIPKQAQRQRALELLRLVGISGDRLGSYPHELSGGMRQRAIIAIALALNPDLIIMDEPTTALDVVVQREILLKIMGLRDDFGFSVIFITHDLSLLLEIADQIAIMYAGRLVETGTSEQLYRQPRHPYTYGLLHSFPTLHGPRRSMNGIPGSPPDLRSVPPGCAFHPRCTFAFEACHRVVPALLAPSSAAPEQQVACHLYDASLNPAGVPEQLRSEDEAENVSADLALPKGE